MEKIKNLYRKYHEQIAYVFYGGLTTAVNFLVFGLFASLLRIDEMEAQLIAWFASVLFAFVTSKFRVFENGHSGNAFREFLGFSARGRCPASLRTAASGSSPSGSDTTATSSSWHLPSLSSSPTMCCPNF